MHLDALYLLPTWITSVSACSAQSSLFRPLSSNYQALFTSFGCKSESVSCFRKLCLFWSKKQTQEAFQGKKQDAGRWCAFLCRCHTCSHACCQACSCVLSQSLREKRVGIWGAWFWVQTLPPILLMGLYVTCVGLISAICYKSSLQFDLVVLQFF